MLVGDDDGTNDGIPVMVGAGEMVGAEVGESTNMMWPPLQIHPPTRAFRRKTRAKAIISMESETAFDQSFCCCQHRYHHH